MRRDIAKVICEGERGGSRDDSKAVSRFKAAFKPQRDSEERHEEYADLDCLPRYEGMMARIKHNWGEGKNFSENLGVLRGLITKNVGKNWDKIYSALCKIVKPNGINIHYHVHQHLDDFIKRETKLVDGEVYCHHGYNRDSTPDWQPLKEYAAFYSRRSEGGFFYYVHPKTRCITRIKLKKVHYTPKEPTFIKSDDDGYFLKLNGVWWALEVAKNYQHSVRFYYGPGEWRTRMEWALSNIMVSISEGGKEARVDILDYIKQAIGYGWRSGSVLPDGMVVVGKRQLGTKELRRLDLVNDAVKDPVWKRTKAGWRNIA